MAMQQGVASTGLGGAWFPVATGGPAPGQGGEMRLERALVTGTGGVAASLGKGGVSGFKERNYRTDLHIHTYTHTD